MVQEKQIILDYVRRLFSNRHFSYCKYPEDDCTCERINITDTTDLISAGYIDSFNIVVMEVMIERTFKIKLNNITAEDFRTVNNMVKLIKR